MTRRPPPRPLREGRRVARPGGGGSLDVTVLNLEGVRGWLRRLGSRLRPGSADVRVEGARYRAEEDSKGGRVYRVVFEGEGRPMQIHPTRSRRYADLDGSERLPLYARFSHLVRPGRRVFELGTGTGEGAAWLRSMVGPSGGVVGVDRDRESVRFARRRWPSDALGFELGWVETLDGELDGSFELVVAWWSGAKHRPSEADLRELWRVVGSGGALVLCTPDRASGVPSWRPEDGDEDDLTPPDGEGLVLTFVKHEEGAEV